jgi:hypothetical protein
LRPGLLSRRRPCDEGTLQEVYPLVEFLEFFAKLMNRRVVGGDPTRTLDSPRERRGDRTKDPDEHPAGGDQPTKINQCELVHGCPPPIPVLFTD